MAIWGMWLRLGGSGGTDLTGEAVVGTMHGTRRTVQCPATLVHNLTGTSGPVHTCGTTAQRPSAAAFASWHKAIRCRAANREVQGSCLPGCLTASGYRKLLVMLLTKATPTQHIPETKDLVNPGLQRPPM